MSKMKRQALLKNGQIQSQSDYYRLRVWYQLATEIQVKLLFKQQVMLRIKQIWHWIWQFLGQIFSIKWYLYSPKSQICLRGLYNLYNIFKPSTRKISKKKKKKEKKRVGETSGWITEDRSFFQDRQTCNRCHI